MTKDQAATLGRQAVACPRWRWMPGMALLGPTHEGPRVLGLVGYDERLTLGPGYIDTYEWEPGPDDLPDLSDLATVGALVALVREAWSCPSLVAVQSGGGVRNGRRIPGRQWFLTAGLSGEAPHLGLDEVVADGPLGTLRLALVGHPSEAAAWVAALEAAP